MGGTTVYTGTQAATVTAGKYGFYAVQQFGGSFWGASIVDTFTAYIDGYLAGRLKLWTGSGWVREKCPADAAGSGHPLKMWDGTTWQTVACMVPV
jgi:hypothetical protein